MNRCGFWFLYGSIFVSASESPSTNYIKSEDDIELELDHVISENSVGIEIATVSIQLYVFAISRGKVTWVAACRPCVTAIVGIYAHCTSHNLPLLHCKQNGSTASGVPCDEQSLSQARSVNITET